MRTFGQKKTAKLVALFFIALTLFAGMFASENLRHHVADFVFARGRVKAALTGVTLNNGTTLVPQGTDVTSQTTALSPDTGIYRWSADGANLMTMNMPFNSGSTQTDFSGNSNNGTPVNGPVYTGSGKVGGAMSFDGTDDYVDLSHNFGIDWQNASFTVSVWANAASSSSNFRGIIGNRFGSGAGNWWTFGILAGYYGTCPADKIGLELGGANTCIGTSFAPYGAGWHHYAVRKTGTSIEIYVDGSLAGSGSVGGSNLGTTTNDLRLGLWLSGGQNFNGIIDEVQVYPRSLSTAEILQLYTDGNSGLGGPTTIKSAETSVGQTWNLFVTPITSAGSAGSAIQSSNTVAISNPTPTITGSVTSPNEINNITTSLSYEAGSTGAFRWLVNGVRYLSLNLPFNSGGTQNDFSGNGNNATVSGATFTTAGCQVGSCYTFDGSSGQITTPITTTLQTFTYEAWVKPQVKASGLGTIVSKNSYFATATNDFPTQLIVDNTASLIGCAVDGGSDFSADLNITAAVTPNAWNHVVCTYQSPRLALYVNGSLASTGALAVTLTNNTGRAYTIGKAASENGGGVGTSTFKGLIDEVKIYSRALSAPQILQDYNDGVANVAGPTQIVPEEHALSDSWSLSVTDITSAGAVGSLNPIGTATITAATADSLFINTPVISQISSALMTYTCTPGASGAHDLLVEYSVNGGGNWFNATIASPSSGSVNGSRLEGVTCNGSVQNFTWNLIQDLVGTTNLARIRITEQIAASPSAQTSNFTAQIPVNLCSGGGEAIDLRLTASETSYDNTPVKVQNCTFIIDGAHTFVSFLLGDGSGSADSVLTHDAATTSSEFKLDITTTGDFTIMSDGTINVAAKGYLGAGSGGNTGTSTGRTWGNTLTGGSDQPAGGSYGGTGGGFINGSSPTIFFAANRPYGDYTNPIYPGSGGGGGGQIGGNGGGAVVLNVGGILSLAGPINANGGNGAPPQLGGGGSGGSISLTAASIIGNTTISANGGDARSDGFWSCGGGGGGRIAFRYTTLSFSGTVTAYGGNKSTGGNSLSTNGGAGTIFYKSAAQSFGQLVINNDKTTPVVSALYSERYDYASTQDIFRVYRGTSTGLMTTVLTDSSAAFTPGAFIGLKLNPNTSQTTNFTITANTATTITISGDLTSVAANGNAYAVYRTSLDDLTMSGSARASIENGAVTITNLSLVNTAYLTHQPSTSAYTPTGLDITATTATLNSGTAIDVSSRGYLGAHQFDNNSAAGRTLGNTNTDASANPAGASYGGLGGSFTTGGITNQPNAMYGDIKNPVNLGSGGGSDANGRAGNGGGVLRLNVSGTLTVNGSLLSNGGNGTTPGGAALAGGGSGGTIYVNAGTITGNGTISAIGGNASSDGFWSIGGGGGGRIAIYATSNTHSGSVVANGGDKTTGGNSTAFNGGAGTIFKQGASGNGDLIINNAGKVPDNDSTVVATGFSFDNVTVQSAARAAVQNVMAVASAVTVDNAYLAHQATGNNQISAGSLVLQNSGVLTHSATTTSAEYKLNVNVTGNVTINSGTSIDVSSKGYLGGQQPGNASCAGYYLGNTAVGTVTGGSYGGLGGNFNATAANAPYGSLLDPNEVGSGGGCGSAAGRGGNGGGLARMTVGGTLTVSGSILANGGNGSSSGGAALGGGGSGGGIYINASTVAGNGAISAIGGNAISDGFWGVGGGGGGRVAIYYTTSTYSGTVSVYGGLQTSNGNSTSDDGSSGTIFRKTASETYGDLSLNNNNIVTAVVTPLFVSNPSTSTYTIRNLSVTNLAKLGIATPCATSGNALTVMGTRDFSGGGQVIDQSSGTCTVSYASLGISSTSPLTGGAVNQAYSYQLQSTGGVPSLSWSLVSGALHPQLSLNSSTGVISGTPTSSGSFSFTVRLTDGTPSFVDKAFTLGISNPPTAPTNLFSNSTNAQACCTTGSGLDASPVFSAVFNDPDTGETGTLYRIQVASDSGFTTLLWDSGAAGTSMSGCAIGARCQDIAYAGSALSMGGVTYYWKIKFWDNAGLEGAFSSTATFTTDAAPTAPTNLFSNESTAQTGLTNPIGMTTAHPVFSSIYHDTDLGDIANKYRVQVDDNNNFSSPVWDSGAAGTSMTNCNEGARCSDITFGGPDLALDGATYYWRIKFWDVAGQQSPWSEDPTATNRFTMGVGAPATISTTTLPNGQVGIAYNQSLSATSGGFTPYVWTCRSGLAGSVVACTTVLPPGLNMSSSGVISGTPTTNGLYPFVVRVTEASPGTNFDEATLSIAIGQAPTAPTTLFTHSTNAQLGSANPTGIDATPVFSAIFHDPDVTDTASKYEVQVATDNAYTNVIWDSGAGGTSITSCANNSRCASINFGGSALALDGSTYYWRIRYWDQNGIVGAFSTESATFVVDRTPTAPSTLFSAESNAQVGSLNPTGLQSIRPVFSAIYNDPDASDTAIKYRIQVDNNNNFASPLWDNGAAGSSMSTCNQGSRCADIVYGAVLPLTIDGTVYYWRIKFFDAAGVESPWSEDPIATNKFTMGFPSSNVQPQQPQSTVPNTPGVGAVQVLSSTSLRYTWIDNSDNETGFRLLDDQNNVIAEVAAGVTTADEIDLPANTAVSGRRVVAFNNVGVSSPSDEFATTVTAATNVRPVVVKRGVNSVTFTISPSLTTQNLQPGNTAVLYEVIIHPSDPTQPIRTLTSDWQKSTEYTFTGISPDDQIEVRVVTRNQTGYANDPTEYVPVDQLQHVFTVNLSVVKKGTGERPSLWEPTDLVSVTTRIKNVGSDPATNVFTNMALPTYIKYQFGSLTVDGRTASDIADDDVAQTSDRDISAIWPGMASGEEHTLTFDLAFDQAALRAFKASLKASANPVIPLQVTVGFTESDQTFASPVVTLEPDLGLVADQPTEQEQQIVQEVPVLPPTQQDAEQVSQLLNQLITQEAQPGQLTSPNQPGGPETTTNTSSDGSSFNVDVTRTDGAKLSVTGFATPNQGQIEFTGTTSEPNSIVTLIFNGNVTVLVTSDEHGDWHTFVSAEQLGIKAGQKAEVRVELIAAKGTLQSDKVSVGQVTIAVESTGDITTRFESSVSAIPGVTAFNEVRKQVAKAIVKQEPAIQKTLASTAPIIVVSSVPLWGYLPYLPTMIYHAITYLVGLIGRKRKNQQRFYGIIYDSISKQPLALAIIRIYNKETNKLVSTQVSDKQGRYEALLQPAIYRLEVTKPSYNFPSHIVTADVDGVFQHIYHNEQGMPVQSEEITVPDVPLDPINAQAQWQISGSIKKVWIALQHVGDYMAAPILIVGSLASLAVVATVPENPINWLLAGMYVGLLAAQLKLRPHLEKAWGVVYDLASSAALPLTTIQLIDPQYGKVVTSRLTDYQGRYSFLPEPGHYVIRANKPGYEQVKEVVEAPKGHTVVPQEIDIQKPDQRITGDVPMRSSA